MSIPNISATTFSYQLRDSIVALLRAQAGGTESLGRISLVAASADIDNMLDTENVAAGVQLKRWKQFPFAQHRKRVVTWIDVILAARSVETEARKANLEDASALLEGLVDAGDGVNGMVPLLNEPANFSLGYAWQSNVDGVDFPYEIREGAGQEVWAFAVFHLEATTYVNF